MKSSIRISKDGNRIHLTGDAANEFFKQAMDTQKVPKLNKWAMQIGDTCGACECTIDENGCGCNPQGA